MSKRKNIENVFGASPEPKRIRNTHPLEDSAILNSAKNSELPVASLKKQRSLVEPNQKSNAIARPLASTSPVDSVPPEILDKVVDLLVHHDYAFNYGGWNLTKTSPFSPPIDSLLALMGTSRSLRQRATVTLTAADAITTHKVWNGASRQGTLDDLPTKVRKHVEEKGLKTNPILLQVGPLGQGVDAETAEPLPSGFISSLLSGYNIRSLILTSVNAVDLALVCPSGLLPAMESLVLKLSDSDICDLHENGARITMFEDAHLLRYVTVLNALLPYEEGPAVEQRNLLNLPFGTITHYLENHRDFDTEILPSILYNVDTLSNLEFLWIRMPSQMTQDIIQTLGPFTLPSLQSVVIDATPVGSLARVPGIPFLGRLRVAGLKSLTLIGHSLDFADSCWAQTDAEGTQFLAILACLQHLESLSLSYPRIPKDSLRQILLATKNVNSLDIHITASKEDYEIVFNTITIQEGEVNPLLLKLQRFSFDVANQREHWPASVIAPFTKDDLSDPELIAAFIKSRRGSGLPEGVIPIEEIVVFTDWDKEKGEKWETRLDEGENVLTYRHLAPADYTHLRHGFQRDRVLERTRCLDGAYEAKQFYACGPLYRDV